MKNVTVTMEDAALEWVRVEAAKRNTSVSRMLGEMIADRMRHDDAYARAMREALEWRSWGASSGSTVTDEGVNGSTPMRGQPS